MLTAGTLRLVLAGVNDDVEVVVIKRKPVGTRAVRCISLDEVLLGFDAEDESPQVLLVAEQEEG